jgi:uncharacterized repeat protein (TIGR03803 family)
MGGMLTPLHSFGSADGANPYAALIQGTDGSFYGTTETGGADGYGTIFKITSEGTLTTMHAFDLTGPSTGRPRAAAEIIAMARSSRSPQRVR